MQVPFLDLKAQHRSLRSELRAALDAVFDDAAFILGPAVENFERAFAAHLGAEHCIAVNSGTSALHLALLACDIGPDDEVITTPHTWISTAWAISYAGARPKFVDIDPHTYNIDPQQAARAVTPRTRALLPVHLYGRPADMTPLVQLAEDAGLALIEDAAQAHGARYQARRVGTFGRAGCFSFYPGKNLGACGEGGAVATNDGDLARRIRRLRDHAQARRHDHVEIGYNMRMEGMQGAALSVKLPHLDAWNAARGLRAARYNELLADAPGLVLPPAAPPGACAWHLYVVLLPPGTRHQVQESLSRRGVATGVHYPTPIHLQQAYAKLGGRRGDFPAAEEVASRCLSLPLYPELTFEQVDYVAAALRESLDELAALATREFGERIQADNATC